MTNDEWRMTNARRHAKRSFSIRHLSLFGVLSGLAAASIWGGMYVVSDVVLEKIPSFALLTLRLLLGFVSLALVAALTAPAQLRAVRLRPWALLGIGIVGYGFSLAFQFVGTKLSTAANGALVTSAAPAFIALFAFFILREPLPPARIAAVALATVGVIIVVFDPGAVRLGGDVLWGNVALLGAALTGGLYSVLVKWATQRGVPALAVTVFAPLGGLLPVIPLAAWELATTPGAWARALAALGSPAIVLGVLYLGLVSTAVAVYLWNKAFELLDATAASLLFFAQPLVGALLSAWLLGEALGVQFFAGGALILLGVLWVTLVAPRGAPSAPSKGSHA